MTPPTESAKPQTVASPPTRSDRPYWIYGVIGFALAAIGDLRAADPGDASELLPYRFAHDPHLAPPHQFPPAPRSSRPSPPRGIAWPSSWDSGNGQDQAVYVKVIGTEQPLRITHIDGFYFFPAWSHDSRHIAYCRVAGDDSGIYLVPRHGGATSGNWSIPCSIRCR